MQNSNNILIYSFTVQTQMSNRGLTAQNNKVFVSKLAKYDMWTGAIPCGPSIQVYWSFVCLYP